MDKEFDREFKNLNDKKTEDYYLQTLLFLAKYYKRPVSSDSLLADLPFHNGYINLSLFKEATKNIGLECKAKITEFEEIDSRILPCVVFMQNNEIAVLLEINKEDKKLKLFFPKIALGEIEYGFEEFKKQFSKKIIIIKPSYDFNNQLKEDIKVQNSRRWFYDTLLENISIYKLIIIAAIFINIFVIFTPLFTMNIYDRVLPNKAVDTLWVLLIGISLVLFFDLVLKLIRAYFIEVAAQRADVKMSSKIFEHILNIKIDSKPSSTGMFVSRLQSFESVREFFTSATIIAFVDLPFILLFIFIIYFIGGNLAYISLITAVIAIIFSWFMQKPIKNTILKSAQEDQIKQTILTETVTGLEIIKSVKGMNAMREQWENSVSKITKYNNKSHYLSQTVASVVTFIASFSSILIVAYGVFLAQDGQITMGAIIACMILNSRVIGPVSQIANMIIRLDKTLISLENINQIMSMPVERGFDKKYLSRPNLKGDISYKEVDFIYAQQKVNALKNINLTIRQGERVGIVGKIGSGKSTLAKLLLNLYEPTKGSILVGDTNISQIDPIDLRKSIGYVPQEPFLFMGSIKDNITIGNQYASDEEIFEASQIAGVHEFLGKHEKGYDLLVGERGEGLSGGERQSVTLARAILSKPNVLLLDEPTNMMDELSENIFKQRIQSIVGAKTLIIITHKPSLLSLVDRLIVMDSGRVVADGKKDDIISALRNNALKQQKSENE